MRITKIELQQANTALAQENCRLREQLGALRFERDHVLPKSDFKARCAAARKLAMESGKVVSVAR